MKHLSMQSWRTPRESSLRDNINKEKNTGNWKQDQQQIRKHSPFKTKRKPGVMIKCYSKRKRNIERH
ncbi:hypothetical protein DsansV1_C06g0062091 [Dioscorea sansibarensis]